MHAFWEGFHMQVMMRGITGKYASPVRRRMGYRKIYFGIFSIVHAPVEEELDNGAAMRATDSMVETLPGSMGI